MRKPAVVMAAAVSAVLAGGIMVATAAGAEETSVTPPAPSLVRPELSAVPRRPAVPVTAGPPVVPSDPAAAARRSAPRRAADPAKPAATGAAKHPAHTSPAAARRRAGADVRGAGKPAAERSVRGGGAATFSAARRDVTAGQALSTDPGGSVQRQALALVNEKRRRGGCAGLAVDRRLIAAADRHAAEMARRGYFAHEDSRGRRAGDRVEDAGYRWSRYGENIARGQGSVAEVVDGWMNSPEHRENIMDCALREVGVGLAFSADRTPYWVQDLATPK